MSFSIKKGFEIEAKAVVDLFRHAPWAANRRPKQIERILKNSQITILIEEDGEPIGFARILTDYVCRAFIEDVIVHPDHQKQGVGRTLIELVENELKWRHVERIELTTGKPEFWEHLGYEPKTGHMLKRL